MNTVSDIKMALRQKMAAYRAKADDALAQYAELVAMDAQDFAPVRRTYSGGKGAKRRSYQEMPDVELEFMRQWAERTRWRDKTGHLRKGYMGRVRKERRNRRIDSRNAPGGARADFTTPERTLGSLFIKSKKIPVRQRTGKEVRAEVGRKWPVRKTPVFRPTGGKDLSIEFRSTNRSRGWRAGKVQIGETFSKELTPEARSDIRRGRGIELIPTFVNKEGMITHYKVVYGGTLKRSIAATRLDYMKMQVAAHVPYAKYVEFGTRHMDARPFMTPAYFIAKKEMAKSIASEMGG